MMRLRLLAAVLGCLAVLASGAMTVAAAAGPVVAATLTQDVADAACTHCNDCDGAACPVPATACLQVSPNAAPTLATATFEGPSIGFGKILWPSSAVVLSGLSPPPEPFPPRP